MAGRSKKKPPGPDFSGVDSLARAAAMYRKGQLEKLFLLPPEFGGQDVPQNVLYVPLGVADVKAGVDNNIIRPLVERGRVTRYVAEPEYQGASVVPVAIKITASDPGRFISTIKIWGDALARDED